MKTRVRACTNPRQRAHGRKAAYHIVCRQPFPFALSLMNQGFSPGLFVGAMPCVTTQFPAWHVRTLPPKHHLDVALDLAVEN